MTTGLQYTSVAQKVRISQGEQSNTKVVAYEVGACGVGDEVAHERQLDPSWRQHKGE